MVPERPIFLYAPLMQPQIPSPFPWHSHKPLTRWAGVCLCTELPCEALQLPRALHYGKQISWTDSLTCLFPLESPLAAERATSFLFWPPWSPTMLPGALPPPSNLHSFLRFPIFPVSQPSAPPSTNRILISVPLNQAASLLLLLSLLKKELAEATEGKEVSPGSQLWGFSPRWGRGVQQQEEKVAGHMASTVRKKERWMLVLNLLPPSHSVQHPS